MKTASGTSLDRRVKRTKTRLRSALVGLILERGWDAVSVLDVCERAEVGRSTFYLHFADKEDLLVSGFDDLLEELHAHRRRAVGTFAFVEALIEHAHGNIRLHRAIVGGKSGPVVHRRLRDVITKLVEAELGSLGVDENQRSATARYMSGGLFELLVGWVETARRAEPGVLADTFRKLAHATLGRAHPGSRAIEPLRSAAPRSLR
ncbi:MAG: TetR/AcrR family transcriptional regulator [Myxococcales bacterium]